MAMTSHDSLAASMQFRVKARSEILNGIEPIFEASRMGVKIERPDHP